VVKKLKQENLDDNLFRKEMADVVPLKTLTTTDSKSPPVPPHRYKAQITPENPDQYSPLIDDGQAHIDADDGSSHRKNGVQRRVMQQLKRGRFPAIDQLDLHSMNTDEGHRAMLVFITYCMVKSLACIRVILGKGFRSENGPRLKHMVRQVLREHPGVLAFTSCRPSDGGSGAVDVLLKSI
jgi:DNA-nicking Smr family endonuclease